MATVMAIASSSSPSSSPSYRCYPYHHHRSHMACELRALNCCLQGPRLSSISPDLDSFKVALSSAFKPLMKELNRLHLPRLEVPARMKDAYVNLLDAFVDSVFQFVDQPLLPSQSNFAPVDELGEAVLINSIEGAIPDDFPEGVYIRNGPNPLFGGLKSTRSAFGRSSHSWIEGEGMLHAIYFDKLRNGDGSETGPKWTVRYNNRYVETETLNLERKRNKQCLLPAINGDSLAVLSAYLLNSLRFGTVNKILSNTNIFEHAGKYYSIAENHKPQEIDISTLGTLGSNWDIDGAWDRPFTSHPKRAPDTGELIIMGINPIKPYMEIGIVSADGKRLLHKADVKLDRCSLCHEIGITQRYNVIMDFPITINLYRLICGGPLIKYNKESYARIGVMPRYGNSDSIRWFEVELSCSFHIFNCFEEGDKVVLRGCRAQDSIIPGPEFYQDNFESINGNFQSLSSSGRSNTTDNSTADDRREEEAGPLFIRSYEWILNMKTGEVSERNLTSTEFSMDFPMVNPNFTGLRNKFGYTQVIDYDTVTSTEGPVKIKYPMLAKLYFDEPDVNHRKEPNSSSRCKDTVKVEYHRFGDGVFCSGAAFVPRQGCLDEDDGWLIAFVHYERINVSQVHIIDCKNVSGDPVAKVMLSSRVPYGFHGAYFSRT